ncbi:MAG: hypothetical protein JZU60_02550 [Ilumatobacteraceae bacterium]|nr:hypothetical protein [Ilumatobacteraceae bacterium]
MSQKYFKIVWVLTLTLFLNACGTATQPAVRIATLTATIPPTLASTATATVPPTSTATPLPAFSLAVEAIIADETTLPEVGAFLAAAKEAKFGAKVTADNKVNIQDIIVIDQNTGKVMQTFEHMGMTVRAEGMLGVEYTIGQNSKGDTVIIAASREWNAKGEWVRRQIQFPGIDGKVETGPMLEVYSNEEVNIEQVVTAKDATPEERVVSNKMGDDIANMLFDRKFFGNNAFFQYGGMFMPAYTRYFFGDNELEIVNERTGSIDLVEVPGYVVSAIGKDGERALVGWQSGEVDYVRIVNKAKLNVPANFNSLFEKRAPKG